MPATRSPTPRTTVYTLTCTHCIFEKKEQGQLAIKAKFHFVGNLLSSQEQRGHLWPKREQIGRRLSQPTGPASRDVTVGPLLESSLLTSSLGLSGKLCQRKLSEILFDEILCVDVPCLNEA